MDSQSPYRREVSLWYKDYKPLNKTKERTVTRNEVELNKLYEVVSSDEYIFIPLEKRRGGEQKHTLKGTMIRAASQKKNYIYWSKNLIKEFKIKNNISPSRKKFQNLIKNLTISYLEDTNKFIFIGADFKIDKLYFSSNITKKCLINHVEEAFIKYKETLTMGTEIEVEHVIIEDYEPEVTINAEGSTIVEEFASIASNVSEITRNINAGSILSNHKEIADAFVKAKREISKLSVVKPTRFGYIGKWLTDNQILKSTVEGIKEEQTRNESTQDNIDYLFGVVYKKYEDLIKTGKGLQKSKIQIKQQIEALQALEIKSDESIAHYETQADIPIDELAINTQIKTQTVKYLQRLTKIDGAIIATQTTITSLAKDLPAMKNDLTDEMAISGLLGSVDDYQQIYTEIAGLVSEVTTATAEKTHIVIENLLQIQIDDTYTTKYIADSKDRAVKLAIMLEDKTTKLAKKVQRDASFISDIAKGNTIEHARKNYKLLK